MNAVLIYDIADDRIRGKVADACLDYGLKRIQYSAFFGDLSANHLEELLRRLGRIVGRADASLDVFPICAKDLSLRRTLAARADADGRQGIAGAGGRRKTAGTVNKQKAAGNGEGSGAVKQAPKDVGDAKRVGFVMEKPREESATPIVDAGENEDEDPFVRRADGRGSEDKDEDPFVR